jgi:Tol biopolymer transport system component
MNEDRITSLGARQLFIGGWSPDDARIVFDASIAGNSDAYLVGAEGGYLRHAQGTFTHMTVSREGRWALATEMVRFDSDLMLLDNFR